MRLSTSKLSCFRDCPYRYYLEYEKGLEPLKKSWPLLDGEALHKALEMYFKPEIEKPLIGISLAEKCLNWGVSEPNWGIVAVVDDFYEDLLTENNALEVNHHKAVVMGMVAGYTILYSPTEFEVCLPEKKEVIEVEGMDLPITTTKGTPAPDDEQFEPLPTCPKSPNIELVVKADRIVRKDGLWWLHETKTTSIVKKEQMMEMLMRDWQTKTYVWAFQQKEYPIVGVVFDVIKKCQLRHTAFETDENFYGRIVKDYIKDAQKGFVEGTSTEKYYYREYATVSRGDLERFEKNLKMVMADLAYAQTHQLWYENDKRCLDYKEPCSFLRVCQESKVEARLDILGDYFRRKDESSR